MGCGEFYVLIWDGLFRFDFISYAIYQAALSSPMSTVYSASVVSPLSIIIRIRQKASPIK